MTKEELGQRIKEQLAAKPVSGDQLTKPTKLKDKGAR